MDLNRIEIDKTGLLFFRYFERLLSSGERGCEGVQVADDQQCGALDESGVEGTHPDLLCQGHHRADEETTALINTDTNSPLKPWPNGIATIVNRTPSTVRLARK